MSRHALQTSRVVFLFGLVFVLILIGFRYVKYISQPIMLVREEDFTKEIWNLNNITAYKTNVIPQSKFIVFGGVLLSNSSFLERVIENILNISTLFDDYHVFIVVDNCTEGTRQLLTAIQYRVHLTVFSSVQKSPIRTENIARARNMVLSQMRNLYLQRPFEYFIMLDLDEACGQQTIHMEAIVDAFQNANQWDAISFNRLLYYDYWALSIPPYYLSMWHFVHPERVKQNLSTILNSSFTADSTSYLTCLSAFNGLAIYRSDIFLKSRYDWRHKKNLAFLSRDIRRKNVQIVNATNNTYYYRDLDCEHRYFHFFAHFRLYARIKISPLVLFDY